MTSPLLVEFLGTSFLLSAISFTGSAFFIGAALAIAVLLGGSISGGHFNPAVTAWAFLSGTIGQSKALSYVGVQLAAAAFVFGVDRFIKH
jgi:aquaporin Z